MKKLLLLFLCLINFSISFAIPTKYSMLNLSPIRLITGDTAISGFDEIVSDTIGIGSGPVTVESENGYEYIKVNSGASYGTVNFGRFQGFESQDTMTITFKCRIPIGQHDSLNTIISKESAAYGFEIWFGGGNLYAMVAGLGGYGYTSISGVQENQWYWYTIVFDGAGADNPARLKIYINDTLKTLSFSGTIPTLTTNHTNDLVIGLRTANPTAFSAVLDLMDIGFYTKIFTQKEIRQILNADGYNVTTSGSRYASGNSITYGTGATVYDSSWVGRIEASHGTVRNLGMPGQGVAIFADSLYKIADTLNLTDTTFCLYGFNDMRYYTDERYTFTQALYPLLLRSATVKTQCVIGRDNIVNKYGTWVDLDLYNSKGAIYTDNANDSIVYKQAGKTIYISITNRTATYYSDSNDIYIDDVLIKDHQNGPIMANYAGISWAPGYLRISGLTDTLHKIKIVKKSVDGRLFFDFSVGLFDTVISNSPIVYLGNCLKMKSYAAASPFDAGSDSIVALYNVVMDDAIHTLKSDGLNVLYVNTCDDFDPFTMTGGDNIHPSDTGYLVLSESFLRVLNNGYSDTVEHPYVIIDPLPVELKNGQTGTFTVYATGTGLTYQWQRNSIDITGATSSTYTFTAEKAYHLADYRCIVTNYKYYTDTSTAATLRVKNVWPSGTRAVIPLTVNHLKVGESATNFLYQKELVLANEHEFCSNVDTSANIIIFDSTTGLQRPAYIRKERDTTAGIKWKARVNSADNGWRSVCYGNGLFVAVAYTGDSDRVMTSPDGINWTSRVTNNNTWRSVCYGNGLFVAVAYNGTDLVMTSPDGITWTPRTSANESNGWVSVCYGNGLFVAVSQSGTGDKVMTSPDGITWTSRNSANDNQWQSVCYGNGLYVAVSYTGTGDRVMTSPDGITWTARVTNDNQWNSVCYGKDLFVAVAQVDSFNTHAVMTSPDAITWTLQNTGDADDQWCSVCYGNGLYVAVAYWTLDPNKRIMTSPDGINWTYREATSNKGWRSVCYGDNKFVTVAYSGLGYRVLTSAAHEDAYIYFDAPASTTTDRTFFACASKSFSRANSSTAFTNSNVTNYWGLDDASTTMLDLADSKNGTLGFTTPKSAGTFDKSINYIGGTNVITIPPTLIQNVSKFTLNMILKFNSFTNYMGIFVKYLNIDNTVSTSVNAGGADGYFKIHNTASYNGDGLYSYPFALSTWYLLSYVFDGTQTGNANRMKVYVNGVQQSIAFTGTVPATTDNNANQSSLGRPAGLSINGFLDETSINSDPYTTDRAISRYNMLLDARTFWTQGAVDLMHTPEYNQSYPFLRSYKKSFIDAFR